MNSGLTTNRIILAKQAMATRFELVVEGTNPIALRAAGEEALDEIQRIEGQLSIYKSSSEIAQINRRAAGEPVQVSPAVFELLGACRLFWEVSGGSFDISVGPLVPAWGFMRGSGSRPTDEEIAQAREKVGMQFVELDAQRSTVRFLKPGLMLDLGSVGKGYALDSARDILIDNGIRHALLHGGTSTICAIGTDSKGEPWKVAIEVPPMKADEHGEIVSVVELCDQALSVSAVWGKSFSADGQTYGHVIDPRTGRPVNQAILGAAVVDSATLSDGLSTAVLVGGEDWEARLQSNVPGVKYVRLSGLRDKITRKALGITVL